MKVTLETTTSLVEIDIDGKRVPARIWEGQTDSGIPVVAFITRISPQTHDEAANEVFAKELKEQRKPTYVPFRNGIDLRFIL